MKLPKSILRGYDRLTEKYVAKALGITLPPRKKKGGESMKIPVSALKKSDSSNKKKKGIKLSAIKSKKAKNDNDGDE